MLRLEPFDNFIPRKNYKWVGWVVYIRGNYMRNGVSAMVSKKSGKPSAEPEPCVPRDRLLL